MPRLNQNQEKELYHVVHHGYCNYYRDCRCRYCRVAHPTLTSLN
nr:MAG TPA: DSBA-like thioredoxin domain [Caudoviricetes sp.]